MDTGSVTLFNNTGERFLSRGSFSQATAGVPGTNEAGDRFGYSLVIVDDVPGIRTGCTVPALASGPTSSVGAPTNSLPARCSVLPNWWSVSTVSPIPGSPS